MDEQIILSAPSGQVTITRTLYGPRTPEEIAWEQADLDRRADQLNVRAYRSQEPHAPAPHD